MTIEKQRAFLQRMAEALLMPVPQIQEMLFLVRGDGAPIILKLFVDDTLPDAFHGVVPESLGVNDKSGVGKAHSPNAAILQSVEELVCMPVGPLDYYIVQKIGIDIPETLFRVIQTLHRGVRLIQYNVFVHLCQF